MSGAGYDVVVDVDEEVNTQPLPTPAAHSFHQANPPPGRPRPHRPARRPRIPLLKLQYRHLQYRSQGARRLIRSSSPSNSRKRFLQTLTLDPLLLRTILRRRYQRRISKMLGCFVSPSKLPRRDGRKSGSLWPVLDCDYCSLYFVLRGNNQSVFG